MSINLFSMQAVGVHLDGSTLRNVLVRKEKNAFVLAKVNPLYTTKPSAPLISGLCAQDLLVHSLSFSVKKSEKLRQALLMQVHAQLHLQEGELISTLQWEKQRATIYSTTQHAVSVHLQALQAWQQEPDRVSAIPEALKWFMRWKAPDLHTYLLIDFGLVFIHCIWVEEDSVRKAHALPREEASHLLQAFRNLGPLVITGGFRDEKFLRQWTGEEKRIECSEDELQYAIPIGLALGELMNRAEPIQLRETPSTRTFELVGRNLCLLFLLSFVWLLGLSWKGLSWIALREQLLMQRINDWVGTDKTLRSELTSAGSDLTSLVQQWVKMTKNNSKHYPFINQTYQVSEVLHWLLQIGDIDQFRYQLLSYPCLGSLKEPYLAKVEVEMNVPDPSRVQEFLQQGLADSSREILCEPSGNRVCRNNRECDGESVQIFCSRARDSASEDKKFVAHPTVAKTDSSEYFGIHASFYVKERDKCLYE